MLNNKTSCVLSTSLYNIKGSKHLLAPLFVVFKSNISVIFHVLKTAYDVVLSRLSEYFEACTFKPTLNSYKNSAISTAYK